MLTTINESTGAAKIFERKNHKNLNIAITLFRGHFARFNLANCFICCQGKRVRGNSTVLFSFSTMMDLLMITSTEIAWFFIKAKKLRKNWFGF